MALPQSGTELIAKGANTFVKDMDRAEKAQRDLGDEIEHSAGKASKSSGIFSKLGGIAGGVLQAGILGAGAALVGFGAVVATSIDDAKEAIAAEAELAAVLESTGGAAGLSKDELLDMASALQDVSLFSDEAVLHAESVLLTFTNIGEEAFPGAIQAAADMSQMLGQDLQSSAVQLGKALNDPINGISALSRVGVSFTEQQKEQIKTMVEAGDVAGAQAIILGELNKEFGGQAQAARDAAGPTADWTVLWGEFQESVGKAVLPMLNSLMVALIPIAQQVLPQIVEAFSGFLNVIGQVIAFAAPFVEQFVGGIVSGLSQVGESATGLGAAWQTLQSIIGLAVEIIQTVVTGILTGVASFVTAHGAEIQAVLSAAWEFIRSVVETTLSLIQGILTVVLAAIRGDWEGAWEAVKTTAETLWLNIQTVIGNYLEYLVSLVELALASINTAWQDVWTGIADFVQGIWDGIVGAVQSGLDSIKGFINSLIDTYNSIAGALGLPAIGHLAAGTDFWRGGPAIVGERGPELVNLPRGSQVIPNHAIYNTTNAPQYNLSMNTTQSSQGVGADFRMMQILAGA